MSATDYLIVGGGIAGLVLAESFEQSAQDFLLVDAPLPGKATAVSAGMINPVTGMRFVLSWNYTQLEADFLEFYKRLENKYKIQLLFEHPIYQRLYLEMDCNAWMARLADPYYEPYLSKVVRKLPANIESLKMNNYGKIEKAYRLHTDTLLTVVRKSLNDSGKFRNVVFEEHDLKISEKQLQWRDVAIHKAIIFAEGFRIRDNSYFNKIPLMPLKGDCIIFYAKDLNWNFVLKDAYSIIPLGDHQYWCGSNFEMNELSVEINQKEIQQQYEFLKNVIPVEFQMLSMQTGIRPAVKDRRPVLGKHPGDPRLIVFNGLGTKGASLAPYCAKVLSQMLFAAAEIPKELSVARFSKYF
ncbi:MAG: FAD-binding oxidoreductase [Saprospiraceae bacterium]|nr:FAD-binding oxidoreductase [Saprospiraceae bacterium]